jgi:hypothetical protein
MLLGLFGEKVDVTPSRQPDQFDALWQILRDFDCASANRTSTSKQDDFFLHVEVG